MGMKRFLETIKLSLTSRAFYQRVLSGTEPMGFKYFFWLTVLFSIVIACTFIPITYSIVSPKVHEKIVNTIPTDLEAQVKEGKVSINQPEPYVVTNKWRNDFDSNTMQKCGSDAKCFEQHKDPKNIVVIDTKTPFSLEQMAEYDTVVLIKEDSIVTRKANGNVEIIKNPTNFNFTFNRDWVQNKITAFSWIGYVIPFAVFVFGITFGFAFMLVAYLVWALIAWLLLYLFTGKKALAFKRAYSVTLYSTTLFFALECISMFLPFVRGNFIQLIIFGLFLYYMTRTKVELEKHEHTPGTPAEHIVEDDDKNNGVM